jgi:hypothetical protein
MKSFRIPMVFLVFMVLLVSHMGYSIVFPDGAGAFQTDDFSASSSLFGYCDDVAELCASVSVCD